MNDKSLQNGGFLMNKMKIRNLFILFIVLLISVIGYVALKNYNNSTEKETEEPETEKIISVDASAINELTYTNNGETLEFVKNNGEWKYAQDLNFRLDASYIDSIINTVSSLEVVRRLEDNLDNISEYGLDSPVYTVNVKCEDGTDITIYIGDNNSISGNYYCYLKDSSIVYMIETTLVNSLSYTLADMESEEETTIES